MSLPSRLAGQTVRQLREIARKDVIEFRDQFGPFAYPIDITELAREAGAQVFTAQLGENVYGMIEGNESGATIYVDAESPINRRRFTIAHELGHMVSYKDEGTAALEYVDERSSETNGTAAEIYANEFAGELLMPKSLLEHYIATGCDNLTIAKNLKVSMQAVSYRRQILGI